MARMRFVGPAPATTIEESERSLALPAQYVVVLDLDDSSALALDVACTGSEGEAPVVRIWPGEEGDELVEGEVASDFGSFFEQLVKERLDLA
jgi:hypothetical protein